MTRGIFAFAVLACAAACGRGGLGPGATCGRDGIRTPLDFSVRVAPVETVVRRDVDLAGLVRVRGGSERSDGGKTQGLTVVEHRLGYKTGVALTTNPFQSRPCAWMSSLAVDMTPGQVTIYVPSEYAADSCEGREILSHERQHEEIHRRLLEKAAADVRAALAKADWLPTRGGAVPVADRAEAEKRFEAQVDKVIDPPYEAFKRDLQTEQAAIDTPENYRFVTSRCSGWK